MYLLVGGLALVTICICCTIFICVCKKMKNRAHRGGRFGSIDSITSGWIDVLYLKQILVYKSD
jgi:hypothetical protein